VTVVAVRIEVAVVVVVRLAVGTAVGTAVIEAVDDYLVAATDCQRLTHSSKRMITDSSFDN